MQTPPNYFRTNLIKYLEIKEGIREKEKRLLKYSFSGLPSNVCHTYGSAPRGSNLRGRGAEGPRPCSLGGRSSQRLRGAVAGPGWGQFCNRGGPNGGAESPSLTSTSPSQRSEPNSSTTPEPPSTQRERLSLPARLKVYRSFPAVGDAGLCSSPVQAAPPRPRAQGAAELQSPSCHARPRPSPSRTARTASPAAHSPRLSRGGSRGGAVKPDTPPPAL